MQVNGYSLEKAESGTWTIIHPYAGTAERGYPTRKAAKADAEALPRASWYHAHPEDAQNLCDHAYDYCAYARPRSVA